MTPVWSFVKTLIGGLLLAFISGVVVAFIVAVVLAFRIASHSSNMSVPTSNHIAQVVFLVVFSIGILLLILVLIRKDYSRSFRASNYSRSSRASNWTAPTTNNTIG